MEIKPWQPVSQATEFRFESKFEALSLCRSSGNHAPRLFQKTIEGFECKINDWALGIVLWHSLGRSDGQAQTQGVSKPELEAVTAGSDLLAWEKCATTLAILIHWVQESKRFWFSANLGQWQVTPSSRERELVGTCYWRRQRLQLCSIFQSSAGPWVKNCKAAAADLNWQPVQENNICSDSKWTAQLLQMVLKSLETMSGMILNW